MDDPGIGEDVAGKRVFVSVNGVGVPGECVGVPVNIEGVSVNNMGVPVECVGVPSPDGVVLEPSVDVLDAGDVLLVWTCLRIR